MKATLLSLALVVLGALGAQANVEVQPDFNMEKFAGIWNVMAVASDSALFQSMKKSMTTTATVVTPLPDGGIEITTGIPLKEKCQKMKVQLKKTDQPGRFASDEHGQKDMRVMATDYINFAFLYTMEKMTGGPSSTTLQLLTRAPEADTQLLQNFRTFYQKVGLSDDQVALLPKSDECFKALSG